MDGYSRTVSRELKLRLGLGDAQISIIGSYGAKARKELPTLVRVAEEKQINIASAVTERHPLESAGATYKALDRGEIVGRAIVDMDL